MFNRKNHPVRDGESWSIVLLVPGKDSIYYHLFKFESKDKSSYLKNDCEQISVKYY